MGTKWEHKLHGGEWDDLTASDGYKGAKRNHSGRKAQ